VRFHKERAAFHFGLFKVQQFGLNDVRDDGELLEVDLSGRNEDGGLLKGMSMTLECDDDGIRSRDSADVPFPQGSRAAGIAERVVLLKSRMD